ncbi:DUF885 domain-containing protein [Pseudoxanthomonas wuyuanensis]|uniref:Uncharacterized conserved protein, DUF885 familyt n=1 Tax=Pseudoxanthomonas wuyuanensis TaxID=1073196 RepID=A0A286D719_9GAMM|nr:DUF885 family protein [Pseudoxanthomonas wuyuanensis]KAF1721124.1 DUF885 domain-containing protein [Pseudoxanthomonas wuyuanensis]SOD54436.1 Uncharacterized conserved protein, DUF885 familyt [Pseudoxanthomonas wuyuanensis]
MSRPLPVLLTLAIALALPVASASLPARAADAASTQAPASTKAAQLNQLYAQYWEESLELNPLRATFQGDPRYNDRLPNFLSADYRQQSHEFTAGWLEKIEAVGADGLGGQDLLSYEIFVEKAKRELEGERFPGWMQPVNQFYNIASTVVQLGSGTGAQPFKTVQDYDNWRKRAARVPVLFDQAIANMREGMQAGVVQPRALMEKVVPQLDALIKPKADQTLFWGPVKNLPDSFSDADKQRIDSEYRSLIENELMPAYRRLRQFIVDEYMPKTRATPGMEGLPDGAAWYAYNARQSTSTDLSPAEIHQLGLDEVARIHGLIHGVMKEVGFTGSLQEFFQFMQNDPRFSFESEEALLAYYRGLEDRINQRVPELFSLIPKASFEIRPVEAFRAQSAAGGSYMRPSEDGSRPGIFYVNTYDLPTRKTWDAEDLYLHEAIPGHHFQLALQQELTGLPMFRRFGSEIAFSEGWGLYAESLGKDLGVYTDPYNYFGYLQNELWRAIRLVVDTGLHSKGWSREQVIAYMLENSAESQTQATAEAERYMAIPGQALAYKIGELKIKQVRARAERELGPKFDIRQFHAEVLKDGSVPLDVLEAKIDRWIAEMRGD